MFKLFLLYTRCDTLTSRTDYRKAADSNKYDWNTETSCENKYVYNLLQLLDSISCFFSLGNLDRTHLDKPQYSLDE